MRRKTLPSYAKAYEPWSTLFTVEPLIMPAVPVLAFLRLNPNLITLASLLFAVLTGIMFSLGHWIWAAVMFQATYITDNLDGKVARLRKMTSEFGAKLDLLVDGLRKPMCFLGLAVYFYSQQKFVLAIIVFVILAVHIIIHKLYAFLDINHCDLEFPEFHRKIIRKIFPRVVALYTFFDEQFFMFIIFPLIAGIIGLPKGEIWFFWGAMIANGLCLLKLLMILNHKRKNRYDEVHQDWFATKGNLDKADGLS